MFVIIAFLFVYSIPFIIIEDKMRVKCDALYKKYQKEFKNEYITEYKLRRNLLYRLVMTSEEKRNWKKFRKTIYFDTDM